MISVNNVESRANIYWLWCLGGIFFICSQKLNKKTFCNQIWEKNYGLLHEIYPNESEQVWIDTLPPSAKKYSKVRCYSWHPSKFKKYNEHVRNWRARPSFRYNNCGKELSFICENLIPNQSCPAAEVTFEESRIKLDSVICITSIYHWQRSNLSIFCPTFRMKCLEYLV